LKKRFVVCIVLVFIAVFSLLWAAWNMNSRRISQRQTTTYPACILASYYSATPDLTSGIITRHIKIEPYGFTDWLPYQNETHWSTPPKDYKTLTLSGHINIHLIDAKNSMLIVIYSPVGQEGTIFGVGTFTEGQNRYWDYAQFRLGNPNPIPFEGNITYVVDGMSFAANSPPNCEPPYPYSS
jgi:hypothetical protein